MAAEDKARNRVESQGIRGGGATPATEGPSERSVAEGSEAVRARSPDGHFQRAAKVCQLTNVHSPLDQRIYYKEAFSLAAVGYEVCVAGPGSRDMEGVREGVRVVTVPRGRGFSGRLGNALRLFRKAASMRADIYHFHDPELLPLGLLLRLMGSEVIYDCHEHFPQTAYVRRWVPGMLRGSLAAALDRLERFIARHLSGVLGVVEEQGSRFGHRPFAAVKNFPRLEWFQANGRLAESGHPEECELLHLGSLSADRGSDFLVDVMRELGKTHPGVRLRAIGRFHTGQDEANFRGRLETCGLQNRILCQQELVPYDRLGQEIRRHRIGLIPGQVSVKNLAPFIPTKLFEYLACGIPVVASDLPSIRAFYEEGDWGAIADPSDPAAHAREIARLLEAPAAAAEKGHRGRALVEERYNWGLESRKLIAFYDRIRNGSSIDPEKGGVIPV
jgi:glycosyltransferase involved in cell wall biosynthesis